MELMEFCRACHSTNHQSNQLVDIFQDDYHLLYMEFTGLKISPEDLYSKFICLVCVDKLQSWSDFKKKCLISLDQYFNEVISVKNESDIKSEPGDNPLENFDDDSAEQLSTIELKEDNREEFESRKKEVLQKERNVASYLEKHGISQFDKKFQCNFDDACNKFYRSLDRYKAHIRTHFGLKEEICFICFNQFSGYRQKKRHMGIHESQHNIKCSFGHCDFSTNCERNLTEHIKRKHSEEPRLPCPICEKSFPTKTTLKAHINTHSEDKNYECIECPKTFKTAGELKSHEISHTNLRPHICTICMKSFKSKSALKIHKGKHENGKSKFYKCNLCGKKFAKLNNLLEHKKAHKNPFICDLCGQTFTSLRSLESHLLSHGKNLANRKLCDICGRNFCNFRSLKRHKETHNTSKDYKCKFDCKYTTNTKRNLETHLKRMHSGSPKRPCPHCGNLYFPESLQAHIRTHSTEKKFICSIATCQKTFRTAGELNVHSTSHSMFRPFNCKICSMSFKSKTILNSHSKIHQKNRKTFNCDLCSKFYVSSDGLKNHKIMAHSTERNFRCDICNSRFAYKTALTMHLNVHRDSRDIHCTVCEATFKHKASLFNHMKGHRNDNLVLEKS